MNKLKTISVKYIVRNEDPYDYTDLKEDRMRLNFTKEVKLILHNIVSYSNLIKSKLRFKDGYIEYGEIRCSNGDFYLIENKFYVKILEILKEYFDDYDYTKTEPNEI